MGKRKLGLVLSVALVFVLAFGLVAAPAVAEPVVKVKFLIGFTEQPGPEHEKIVRDAGGDIKYTFHIVPVIAASGPESMANVLRQHSKVTHVDLDGRVYIIGQTLPWGVDRIDAEIVHTYNKGTGVKVAIIDTGIDYTHEDLDANYKGGYDFVNADTDPIDDHGHGTHVAGTVAAEDNDIGVVGVAPEAALYALKVLDETGGGYWSDVIAAIQWSVDKKMQVINMSLGGTGTSDVESACQAAWDAGLLLVAAAGNSGNPPGKGDNVIEPASYASVIAIAATNQDDVRARWSSTGPDLELAAPGVDINSTLLGGGYGEKNGTSMASPHVAGTAALVWLAYPLWTNADVRTQLQNTADDLGATGFDTKYGYGLVDAENAVLGTTGGNDLAIDTGAIDGTVTVAGTDPLQPIQGAEVNVEGTNLTATTNTEGYYIINDVPVGTYTVTASAGGYESQSVTDVTVTKDSTTTVNFTLTEAVAPTGTMSVDSITFSAKKAGPNLTLYTTVKVVLEDGSAVDGARVEMTLTHESGSSWDFAGNTKNSTGEVKFTLLKAPSGYYTAKVTKVSHTDYGWDGVQAEKSCKLDADGTVTQ